MASVPFTSGQDRPLGEVVERALASGAGGVLVVANALDSASLCQQIRKRDGTTRIYGTDWGFTPAVIAHGGRAVEGAVFTYKVDADRHTPAFDRFASSYQARFSRAPDFAAVFSYEAVLVAGDALRKDATREGVRAALLAKGTFAGLQDEIRIDRHGDGDRRQLLMTVRDGRIVALE